MEHRDLLANLDVLELLEPLVQEVLLEVQELEDCQVELEPLVPRAKWETQDPSEPVEGQVELGLQVQRVLLVVLVHPEIQAAPAPPVQLEYPGQPDRLELWAIPGA